MKTGNSKLFRKLALNRRSNVMGDLVKKNVAHDCVIPVNEKWWKAKTIKGDLT